VRRLAGHRSEAARDGIDALECGGERTDVGHIGDPDLARRIGQPGRIAHDGDDLVAGRGGGADELAAGAAARSDDKQGLFMAVLQEQLPGFALPDDAVGTGTVEANLVRLVSGLLDFYVDSFPISASIFSSSTLLALLTD